MTSYECWKHDSRVSSNYELGVNHKGKHNILMRRSGRPGSPALMNTVDMVM